MSTCRTLCQYCWYYPISYVLVKIGDGIHGILWAFNHVWFNSVLQVNRNTGLWPNRWTGSLENIEEFMYLPESNLSMQIEGIPNFPTIALCVVLAIGLCIKIQLLSLICTIRQYKGVVQDSSKKSRVCCTLN